MKGHNICFYAELSLIINKYSLICRALSGGFFNKLPKREQFLGADSAQLLFASNQVCKHGDMKTISVNNKLLSIYFYARKDYQFLRAFLPTFTLCG